MKKIILAAFASMCCFGIKAQTTFEASDNYARLRDLTYDATVENKIYAITIGNHIVVSNNNGATWDLLYSYPGAKVLKNLKMVPGNKALAFGTDEAVHILDLTTNTVTATFPVPQNGVAGADPSYLVSYAFYDANGVTQVVNTAFKIQLEGGLSINLSKVFYTNNGGATWNEIYYTIEHDNIFINDVAISPVNPARVYLARGNGNTDIDGGLLISTNAGQDWSETLEGITLDAITFNPGNANDMMIGSSIGDHPEKLYRSADNGSTWNEIAIAWTDQTLNCIRKIAFNPQNTDQIIVLEENEMARTNDGGITWVNNVYPAGISTDYYYGTNASYNPFNSNQIAISNDMYPKFFNNTTETLTQIEAPFFNITNVSAADYAGNTNVYYGGQGGRHHKNMTNGVISVYDAEEPIIYNVKKNYIFADPTTAGRIFTFASGFSGGLVTMSTDYGATTTTLLEAFAHDMQAVTVDPNNTNIIYVSMRLSESSNVFKIDVTDINNIVWAEIFTPQLDDFNQGVVGGIVIDPANSDTLYISKKNKVFKSIDGGFTWAQLENGLEEITDQDLIWNLVSNPLNPNQLTLGTSNGIFTSMDSGATWSQVLTGTNVGKVKHSTLNDGVIVGSVYTSLYDNSAIVYTANNGATWLTVTSEHLKYAQSGSMDYIFAGTDIIAYIATTDIGVMQYIIHDVTLGTNHPEVHNPLRIYPNPAKEIVTIHLDGNDPIELVSVYSLTGQQVLQSNTNQLDVFGLSNGIYLVKVDTNDGKSFVQKLVKE